MAFKMKSGNKVSFKNMGSSPGKQKLKTTDLGDAFQKGLSGRIDPDDPGYVGSLSGKDRNKGLVAEEKRLKKATTDQPVDTTTNKEAGDKKSKWGFDWMQLLDSFLTSGGGKKGLFKAAGAALRGPDEPSEREKAQQKENERIRRYLKNLKGMEEE